MSAQLNIFPDDEPAEALSDIDRIQGNRSALAAEHLVCAHLLSEGFDAFLVGAANRPYDVLIDTGNLFRLQVKSNVQRLKHFPAHYRFGLGAAQQNGGLAAYKGKVDGFAFVALDIRRIIYLHVDAITTKSISFTQQDFASKETPSWNHLKSLLKL